MMYTQTAICGLMVVWFLGMAAYAILRECREKSFIAALMFGLFFLTGAVMSLDIGWRAFLKGF